MRYPSAAATAIRGRPILRLSRPCRRLERTMTVRSKRMSIRPIPLALLLVPGVCAAGADQSANSTVRWAASMLSPTSITHGSDATVELSADVQEGWHVYALKQRPGGPTALRVTLDDNNVARLAGAPSGTVPEKRHDPSFDLDTQFYSHSFV